jgi:selenium metabolism protein YedF
MARRFEPQPLPTHPCTPLPGPACCTISPMRTLVVIASNTMGSGRDELGGRLITKYFAQLGSLPNKPHAIAFYNAGVTLLVKSSPVLAALAALEEAGVELLACGTCIEDYGILGQISVGRVTDMREIVSEMMEADKVVTI